jgi:hypothetical protein
MTFTANLFNKCFLADEVQDITNKSSSKIQYWMDR